MNDPSLKNSFTVNAGLLTGLSGLFVPFIGVPIAAGVATEFMGVAIIRKGLKEEDDELARNTAGTEELTLIAT